MRVLFISPHSDPQARLGEPDAGGQCIYEHELAIELAKNGIEVITFCRQRNHFPSISRVISNYTIYRITAGGEYFIPKENIVRVLPEFTTNVIKILEKRKHKNVPTLVHSHYWDGGASALLLKANYQDFPMIWTPHSLGFPKRDKYRGISHESFHHFISRLTWENYTGMLSNKLICSTRNEKSKLIRYYHIFPKRISVIPPGISIGSEEHTTKYLRKWKIKPGTRILLCIGRIARTKGYQHAIRIIHRLRDRLTERYVLIIVGGGSRVKSEEEKQYMHELKRLTVRLGVTDRVIFQPSVPHHEVQAIYALADIHLMTAEEEPFGLTTIEAMASGTVVISHNRGGAKNIIDHRQTGFVTDIHKYNAVADLITDLFRHLYKLERIGTKARIAINHKYSWNSRIGDYLKLYEQVAAEPSLRLKKALSTDHFLKQILKI